MTGRLVALDLAGGPLFVETLQRVWDRGDAAFPLDQRLPGPARDRLLETIAPERLIDAAGDEIVLDGGRPVEPGDALVVATSGSTGEPRGVVLTHSAVAASAEASSNRLAVTTADHWLACLPLSHVGGLSVITRALHRSTRLTVLPGVDAARIDATDATLISLVATTLERVDPTRFRTIVLGGSRPPDVRPSNAVVTYGSTETGSGVVYDGVPLEGVEIRIDAQPNAANEADGEILVRGPMLFRGYRGDATSPFENGWFRTGDLGRFDDSGRLTVSGRAVDLVITGGENVWPEQVETVLRGHADVSDVAVAGTDDPEWGQVVTAYVVPAGRVPTLDDLRNHVREVLPAFAAPRRLVVVDRIPRTSLGKIARHRLPTERRGQT